MDTEFIIMHTMRSPSITYCCMLEVPLGNLVRKSRDAEILLE